MKDNEQRMEGGRVADGGWKPGSGGGGEVGVSQVATCIPLSVECAVVERSSSIVICRRQALIRSESSRRSSVGRFRATSSNISCTLRPVYAKGSQRERMWYMRAVWEARCAACPT